MGNNILLIAANFLSCFIINIIIFQFMSERYELKRLSIKKLYYPIILITSFLIVGINMLNNPILNLLSWLLTFGLFSAFLYDSNKINRLQRIVETNSLIMLITVIEALGSVLMDYILLKMNLYSREYQITRTFLEVTLSKIIIIFFYYIFIRRVWKKEWSNFYSPKRFLLYVILFAYSFLNMFVIIRSVSIMDSKEYSYLLLINSGCIVFANLYFIYFIQYVEENSELKAELKLIEQQADMQFRYYNEQENKFHESLSILHDVDKHIRTIEKLYISKNIEEAVSYTKDISNLLKPLVPIQYTNSPILNILLKDKMNLAEQKNITCKTEIEYVDLSFMQPIDITTIFGNLLDNAIEAQDKVMGEKIIFIKISSFHEMISVRMENNSVEIKNWNHGKLESTKGKHHGIGLINVQRAVEHYEGSLKVGMEGSKFYCNILLNS